MEFDITPWLQHPYLQPLLLLCAGLVVLKGIIVIVTEVLRLLLPLVDVIKTLIKRIKNGNNNGTSSGTKP